MTTKFVSSRVQVLAPMMIVMLLASGCSQPEKASTAAGTDSAAFEGGFVQIFDGKTFTGWDGDTSVWRIDSNRFIGEVTATRQIKTNSFLIWRAEKPADFEFIADYRISAGGNSGVQYRSEEVKDIPYAVKGYQADIDGANQYTGQNYEERGRGFLARRGQKVTFGLDGKAAQTDSLGNSDSLKTHIRVDDWNEIHIVAKGNHMQHYINGILMSEFTDNDTAHRKSDGILAFQVHVLPSMKVEFRNIRYKKE